MIDAHSAEPGELTGECAHERTVTHHMGDGTPVEFCPECGRNISLGPSPVHPAAPQSSAPSAVHSGQAAPNAPLAEGSAPINFRLALNVRHPACHRAADAFWNYWSENGETHRHGYYESTWGAINRAIRMVGVTPHDYGLPPLGTDPSLLQRSLDSLKLLVHCRDSMTVADFARAYLTIQALQDALFGAEPPASSADTPPQPL